MDEKIFLDTFNIKTYPELIINYLKLIDNKTKINNLRSFYFSLLESISTDVRESYLNRILKYLSSKEESTILILDDIKDKIYEKNIILFFKKLHNLISADTSHKIFYANLIEQCNFIFFEEDELNNIKQLYNEEKYDLVLYELFIHACDNYRINTPKIVSERLLNDSYCLYNTTKLKPVLIKAAADLGNELACLQYSIYAYPDYKKQLTYLLKGKSLNQCLWEIGFIIENFIDKETLDIVKKELKPIFVEGNKYMQNIIVINEDNIFYKQRTLDALKIYFYLANEKKFSKALCSVGKFFLEKKVAIINNNKINEKESLQIGFDYSYKAIKLGNIHAMQNIGTFYYNNNKSIDTKYKDLLKIGANFKDLLSSIYYSKILIDENKIDEAETYLKFIAEENDGEALFRLGKIYEMRMQNDDAIKYYEKAINNNYYSASIELSKLYFTKYMNNELSGNIKNSYLLLSINILKKNYEKYSESEKKEADLLIKNFESLL